MTAHEALVGAAVTAGRASPDHRAELTTQWLCGERLSTLERSEDWCRVRGPDGYEAWTHRGGIARCESGEAERWTTAASARSLGATLVVDPEAGSPSRTPPRRLPWGAPVLLRDDGGLRLPCGAAARIADGSVVAAAERASRFPPDGAAVAETGLSWLGAPYLWGGRTRAGVDCSAFVQIVYEMHGVPLPRDSTLQKRAGPPCHEPEGKLPRLVAGDLLFFAWEGGPISHVALSAGGTLLVHASATWGCVVVEDLAADAPFPRRLVEGFVAATRPLAAAASV